MALAVLKGDVDALRRAAALATPVTLAGERSLPVLDALEPLLPAGIRRGVVASVDGGPGATSLALALGAAASREGSWTALVGAPSVGLLTASEVGLAMERLLVVADPPERSIATVVAALLDTVDVVYVRAPNLAAPDARRLVARAREREAVLIPLGRWPLAADVRLSVSSPEWSGLAGCGAGRLTARRVQVVASGKGTYARERRAALWLPDENGAVSCAT
jgi:hypothetical protein